MRPAYNLKHKDIFSKTFDTVQSLANTLGRFPRKKGPDAHYTLRDEIDNISYNYLCKSISNNLGTFLKKLEYLELMLGNIEKACDLVEDPNGPAYISDMVIGIEKNLFHREETSWGRLFSFFYISAEEQLSKDISIAVDKFNKKLNYNEIGSECQANDDSVHLTVSPH